MAPKPASICRQPFRKSADADNCTVDLKAVNRAARECDEEIAILRDRLAARLNRRDELRVRASHYRSILSPIRRLPKELLIEIFSGCLTDYFRTVEVGTYGWLNEPSKLPIMRLLRVCSHWCHIILSTGSLWSQFQCRVDDTFENGGIGWACLEMHLERSQDCPLSFLIWGDAILPAHSLLHRLLQETRRWRHVSFSCDAISLRSWGNSLATLPCLRMLHIESTNILDDGEEVSSIEFPSNSLLYLDISPTILHRVVVAFKHLRYLGLSHYSSTAQLFECLCNATHVEFIEFWQGRGRDDEDDFNYTEFRENSGSRKTLGLQAMTLFISSFVCQGALLNLLSTCFHMPHLHTFKLGKSSGPSSAPGDILDPIVIER
ncbi:hypothetical protein BDZ89DRAFT_1069736 [Hymenopellis radicata]|nr:hypothetical protein BDZ89DRAFT_1069736 [Hymenopellis radicata]